MPIEVTNALYKRVRRAELTIPDAVTLLRQLLELGIASIGKAETNELSDYLKFRHLKCNIYGFMLDWEKMKPLVEKLPQTIKKMKSSIHTFFELLAEMVSDKSQ